MKIFQLSIHYNLQKLIRNSNFLRRYYFLFKALNLSTLSDKNDLLVKTERPEQRCKDKLQNFLAKFGVICWLAPMFTV